MDSREGAVDVLVPHVSRFGEKNKATGEQGWEDLPLGSMLEGLLLPPPSKVQPSYEPDLFAADESPAAPKPTPQDYRLLKNRHPARHPPHQVARLGNDRAPAVRHFTPP